MKTCPKCYLRHEDAVIICDCGYNFNLILEPSQKEFVPFKLKTMNTQNFSSETKLCEVKLENSDDKKVVTAQEHFNRGKVNANKCEFYLAVLDYSKAIEISPNEDMYYYYRGIAYSKIGSYEDAISDFSRGIDLNPSFSFHYKERATAKIKIGDQTGAVEDLETSVDLGLVGASNILKTIEDVESGYSAEKRDVFVVEEFHQKLEKANFGIKWKEMAIKLIMAGMLLWAIADNPYSYYGLLKWAICIGSLYFGYKSYKSDNALFAWVFGCMAVVFNPIAPIRFERETWQFLDLTGGTLILINIIFPIFREIFVKIKAVQIKKNSLSDWKNARYGLILFGFSHIFFESLFLADPKNVGAPVVINYLISRWYVKEQMKDNQENKNYFLYALLVSSIVFVIRVIGGLIIYQIVLHN